MNAFILCLIALLSADNYGVRESATAGLRALADWDTLDAAWRTSACPEAQTRLNALRCAFIIRECDALANGKYPRSHIDLKWPIARSLEWTPDYRTALHTLGYRPYELWDDPSVQCEEERATTRNALVRYVSRTGDWGTVRRILK